MIFSIHSTGKLWQTEIPEGTSLALALGCFDGVHIGHRALINEICGGEDALVPAVWTFAEPLTKPYIENIETRIKLCAGLGVKFAICESYERFCKMSPESFVEYLNALGVKKIACGEDYRFGFEKAGDVAFLKAECAKYGIEVKVVGGVTVTVDGKCERVSSTLVRSLIKDGRMELVKELLTRNFDISGVIIGGNNLGKLIQVPTINQRFDAGRIVPKHGVYVSVCNVEGEDYPSITNIGNRPTIEIGSHDENCETHIIGQKMELYGKIAQVKLCHFIRPENKYGSLEELRAQIEKDIAYTNAWFEAENKKN